MQIEPKRQRDLIQKRHGFRGGYEKDVNKNPSDLQDIQAGKP